MSIKCSVAISYNKGRLCTTLLNFFVVGSRTNKWLCTLRTLRYVCRKKIIMGGCGIWLSNMIVEEVIEVDKLDNDTTSAVEGK